MADSWLKDATDPKCQRLLRAGRALISSCESGETSRAELVVTLGALVVLAGVSQDELTRAVHALCDRFQRLVKEEARRAVAN